MLEFQLKCRKRPVITTAPFLNNEERKPQHVGLLISDSPDKENPNNNINPVVFEHDNGGICLSLTFEQARDLAIRLLETVRDSK